MHTIATIRSRVRSIEPMAVSGHHPAPSVRGSSPCLCTPSTHTSPTSEGTIVPTSSSWSNFDSPHARCHDICSCAGIPAQLPPPPARFSAFAKRNDRASRRASRARQQASRECHGRITKRTTKPDAAHGPARSNLGAKTSLERASEDESRLNRAHAHVPTSDARCRPTRAALRCTLARCAADSCVCCG
jgi:hypothetical protein